VPRLHRTALPGVMSAIAAQADADAARVSALPFNRNRAWEQATLFAELALGGVAARALPPAAALLPERLGGLPQPLPQALRQDGEEDDGAGPGGPDPAAFVDASRVQLVPQAWLNSYPPLLASKLHDHRGGPMHAPYAPGDWIVSFSGCGVLLGAAPCEALFAAYASGATAAGGGG